MPIAPCAKSAAAASMGAGPCSANPYRIRAATEKRRGWELFIGRSSIVNGFAQKRGALKGDGRLSVLGAWLRAVKKQFLDKTQREHRKRALLFWRYWRLDENDSWQL